MRKIKIIGLCILHLYNSGIFSILGGISVSWLAKEVDVVCMLVLF
jgi:hypothetical protein